MEFNNLKQIYHREDIKSLPFPKFHLNISLYATRGSQIIQGPFITTSESIGMTLHHYTATLKTLISLGAGLGGSLLLLILVVIIFILIVVILSIRSKKKVNTIQEKHKCEKKEIEERVDRACDEATRDVEDLESILNKLDKKTGEELKACLGTNLTRLKDHIDSARQKVVADAGELPDKEVELSNAKSVLDKLLNVVSIQEDTTSPSSAAASNVIEMHPV